MQVLYDKLSDSYYTTIDNVEVWCKCPVVLADILHRLDDRETRREDTRAIYVSVLLAAGLIALTAAIAALVG
jgi:hypothetical protein